MKRQSKVMSIVALAVCVVGLTIGFAAFSNTLTIKSGATVTPNASDFQVGFSLSANSLTTGTIKPTVSGTAGATASDVVINNTMSNGKITLGPLSAAFTQQNQTVVYEFYVYNSGKYTAYLNGATFDSDEYDFMSPDCKTDSGNANVLLADACAAIGTSSSVEIEDASGTNSISLKTSWPLGRIISEMPNNAIEPGESQKITITLGSGSALIDEDITVTFPALDLVYESVMGEA